MKKYNKLITLCILSASASYAATHEAEITTNLGYDSNPLRIEDDDKGGAFAELDLGYEYTNKLESGKELSFGADYYHRTYDGAVDDADRWSAKIDGAFKFAERETAIGKLRPDVTADLNWSDRTYTSRNTGKPASFGGQSIEDRYDSFWLDLNAGLRDRINRKVSLYLDFDYRIKDYRKDYQSLGLDRLDYEQFGVRPRIRYRFNKSLYGYLGYKYQRRSYDDRRQRTLANTVIPGTDLKYDHHSVDLDLTYKFNDHWSTKFGGGVLKREDNGTGYADKSEYSAYVKAIYEAREQDKYSLEIAYIKREFDNPTIDPNGINEETPGKEGWSVEFETKTEIKLANIQNLFLVSSISYDDFDETPTYFRYDRYQVSIGLSKEF